MAKEETGMRSFVITTFALAVALGPASAFAQSQQPSSQQPPAQQPPAGQQPPAPGTQPPPSQPAQQPQQQQQQATPGRSFTSDAGMFFNQIKPDKTADFERIMGRVKEALAKSSDPVRKQQAASWKVFKSVEAGPGGNVLYLWVMDPAVKGADYTITKILAEAFPSEVQELYKTLVDCYPAQGGQSIVNLQQVMNMGGAPAAGGK
jgi:hypothetical protein